MMMRIEQINHIYFLGIGGIGMSALARYFKYLGKKISGYDRVKTDLTTELESEGMVIHYDEDISSIPVDVELVIYTPAIPSDSVLFVYLKDTGLPIFKRAQALGMISQSTRCIGIAGTHGKTTTSVLTTYVLDKGGIQPTAFLGGIALDYQSNFVIGEGPYTVVEADEYDRSFLQLSPYIGCILSLDPDHLDIYGDTASIVGTYNDYIQNIQQGGIFFYASHTHEALSKSIISLKKKNIQCKRIGTSSADDIVVSNISVVNGMMTFDYQGMGVHMTQLRLPLPGQHNVMNAAFAISIGLAVGVSENSIITMLPHFRGIKRRFEFVHKGDNVIYIDDYAHHPTEIKAAVEAARKLYPTRHISAIFQPHLYSRTQDFYKEFAAVLSLLDAVILLDIYPAREKPMIGVTSQIIFDHITINNKILIDKIQLIDTIKNRDFDILMTLGAGDIDMYISQIKKIISHG